MAKEGSAYIEIRADNAHLQGDLNAAHSRIEAASHKMEQSMLRILKVGMVAAVAAVGAAAVISVKQFAEFEVALNRLGNVSDRSLGVMRKEILGMSSELGSVTELTKGYYQVLSAGITDPIKSMEMLTVSAKMSKEATIAQGDAVRGIVAVMGAYSDELKTATEAADLLYSIERSGITSVGELIPLIGNLANLSKAVGLSANEMAAALAQITTTGAGTSIAATQLQGLLVALNRRFKALPPVIQAYGSAIAAVKAMGFQNVLQEIMRYTEGNATVLTKMLGRQEGYLGLLQLTKNEFGEYADRLEAMTKKAGAFDDAWKRYKVTLKALWDTFKNTIGRQAVLLGAELAPKIGDVLTKMSKWVVVNRDLISQKTSEAITKIKESIKGIVDVYNSLPDGIVGAAGTGLLIRMLTGSTPIGALAATLYVINTQLDKMTGHVSAMSASLKVVTGLLLHSAFGGFLKWAGGARVAIFALGKLSLYVAMVDGIARVYTAWKRMSKFVTETPATWGAAARLAMDNVVNAVINSFVALGNLMKNLVGLITDPLIAAFTSFSIMDLMFGDLTKEQAWASVTSSMESAFKNALSRVGDEFHVDMSRRVALIASDADRKLLANWAVSGGTTPKTSIPITVHLDERSVEENIKKFFEDRKSDLSNLFETPIFIAKTEIEFEVNSTDFIKAYNAIEAVKASASEMAAKIETVYGKDIATAYIASIVSALEKQQSIWETYNKDYQILLKGETQFKVEEYAKDLQAYLAVEQAKTGMTDEQIEERKKLMLAGYEKGLKKEKAVLTKVEDYWKHTLENIQDATANTIYKIIDNWRDGFSSLFNNIRDWFKMLLSQMAAQALTTKIIFPAMGTIGAAFGMPGTAEAGGGGGGNIDSSLWGGGLPSGSGMGDWVNSNVFGGGTGSLTTWGATWGNMMSYAAIAFNAIGFINDLGEGNYGAAAGAGIGTGIGAFLGGPLGAVIGGGIGKLVGSLVDSIFGKSNAGFGTGFHALTTSGTLPTAATWGEGITFQDYWQASGASGGAPEELITGFQEGVNAAIQATYDAVGSFAERLPDSVRTAFEDALAGITIDLLGPMQAGFAPLLGTLGDDFVIAITRETAPILEEYINVIPGYLLKQITPQIETAIFDWVGTIDTSKLSAESPIMTFYNKILGGTAEFAGSLEDFTNAATGFADIMDQLTTAETEYKNQVQSILNPLSAAGQQLVAIDVYFTGLITTLEQVGYTVEAIADIQADWTAVTDKIKTDTWTDIAYQIDVLNGNLTEGEQEILRLTKQFEDWYKTAEETGASADFLTWIMDQLGITIANVGQTVVSTTADMMQAAANLSQSLASSISSLKYDQGYGYGQTLESNLRAIADMTGLPEGYQQYLVEQATEYYDLQMDSLNAAQDTASCSKQTSQTQLDNLKALEKSISAWKNAYDDLASQILGYQTSTTNPQDVVERLAIARQAIMDVTGGMSFMDYVASLGTQEEQIAVAKILQNLSNNYLTLAQEALQRPSIEYQEIYTEQMGQLTGLLGYMGSYAESEWQIQIDQLDALYAIRTEIERLESITAAAGGGGVPTSPPSPTAGIPQWLIDQYSTVYAGYKTALDLGPGIRQNWEGTGATVETFAGQYMSFLTSGGQKFWYDASTSLFDIFANNPDIQKIWTQMYGYAQGTNYVLETGPAWVHKGEQIIPAGYDYPELKQGNNVTFQLNITGNDKPEKVGKVVREELSNFMRSGEGRKLIQSTAKGQ